MLVRGALIASIAAIVLAAGASSAAAARATFAGGQAYDATYADSTADGQSAPQGGATPAPTADDEPEEDDGGSWVWVIAVIAGAWAVVAVTFVVVRRFGRRRGSR